MCTSTEMWTYASRINTRICAAIESYLEVSAYEQQVDLDVVLLLSQRERRIDAVELAMTATFHGDLWRDHAHGRGRMSRRLCGLDTCRQAPAFFDRVHKGLLHVHRLYGHRVSSSDN